MKITVMKTIVALFFACCFCAAAGAQTASVIPNTPAPLQMTEHIERASQHAMGLESTLLSVSGYGYAKGEVPLAELGSPVYEIPLGDVARANKIEHASVPKALIVLEKQGDI